MRCVLICSGKQSQRWNRVSQIPPGGAWTWLICADVKSIPETEVFKLGKEIQQLQYYLAMSASSGALDTPTPADMKDFGFQSTAESLNLISAVSIRSHLIILGRGTG